MGKSRSKKSKQVAEPGSVAADRSPTTESPSQVNAIDGHNTQGWTDGEIRAYNDLIVERQRLEKQRNQLEEKCAKSQTQRALLHENIASIDGMFKAQKPMSGLVKYTGSSACCVDLDLNLTKCHHELCRRAKSEGISDSELDTIKYYAMRMYTEKSDRVRNALRKQRDIELDRVRKEEQEEQSQIARKSAKKPKPAYTDMQKSSPRGARGKEVTKAAKETEKIVNKIINQLDDLRTDLQAGRISAEEAQGKLDLLDRNLPLGHSRSNHSKSAHDDQAALSSQDIDLTKQTLQTDLRDRLLGAKGDTFSQAFSIMDHFLSATKPGDLQDAISELKDVLQLAGPMCDDLQKSLGALEGIFDNPERLAFTGPDGKQECSSSIIELMEKLKDNLKRTGQLPDGANASLTKVFQDCIDLEEDAKTRMVKEASSLSLSTNELQNMLIEIKDECVAKSPIPPLTSNKLNSDISALLDIHDAHRLLTKTRSGAESQELEAQIAAQVISRTPRRPEMYIETLKRLEVACRQVGRDDYAQLLEKAFSVVLEKMSKFKPQPQTKKEPQPSDFAKTQQTNTTQSPHSEAENGALTSSSVVPTTLQSELHAAAQVPVVDEGTDDIEKTVQERVRNCRAGELWEIFELYHCDTTFEADLAMFDKLLSYKDQARTVMEDKKDGIQATVVYLFNLQLCPAFSAALIAQSLWDLVDRSGRDIHSYVKQLARCIDVSFPSISEEWTATFRHLVLAMMQLYVASFVEATAALPEISAVHFAVFTVTIFTTFVHLTRTASQAYENLAVMTNFLSTCFNQNLADFDSILDSALVHYGHFCRSDHFKCMTSLSCSKHMVFQPERAISVISGRDQDLTAVDGDMASNLQPQQVYGSAVERLHSPASSEHDRPRNNVQIGPSLNATAHCRPNEHPRRRRERHVRTLDARLAECLRKAAILHESTAKKALALLQLRADEYASEKALPPTELLLAMDELLNVADDSYRHPVSDDKDIDQDKRSVHSRFAEHLDEPLFYQKRSTKTVLAIQNVFKMLRTGLLGEAYLNECVDKIKALAMSGQFSNPIQFIDRHRANLARVGKLPESFAQALVQAQNEIFAELELADVGYAYETKRLKRLLAVVGESAPYPSALFRLATHRRKDLDEYLNIVASRFAEIDEMIAIKLEDLWLQLQETNEAWSLEQNSPVLIELADLVMRDWCRRPADITKHDSNDEDCQPLRAETDDKGVSLPSENGRSPATAKISKKPKSRLRYLMNTEAATEASVLLTDQHVDLNKSPVPEESIVDIQHAPAIQSAANSTKTYTKKDGKTASQQTNRIPPLAQNLSNGHRLDSTLAEAGAHLTPINTHAVPNTHVPSTKPAMFLTSIHNTDGHKSIQAEYLSLPSNPTHNPAEPTLSGTAAPPRPSSTPTPSFRQLDMAKRLASLQANSRDLTSTAKSVTNGEHARVLEGLAGKLQDYVAGLADAVDKLAELKGVQIAGFDAAS